MKTPRTQFQQTQGGTVEKENEAHELRFFDVRSDQRVFIHPSSALFSATTYKSEFVAYFTKTLTSKLYIRDVSEVRYFTPLASLLVAESYAVSRFHCTAFSCSEGLSP